jgi:rRNA maturation protein Nop10
MGHKLVCLNCRKANNIDIYNLHIPEMCNECGDKVTLYPHLFQPPKKSDLKAWKIVQFLFDNGFIYYHIRNEADTSTVQYPRTMLEAKEFIVKYKDQAITI